MCVVHTTPVSQASHTSNQSIHPSATPLLLSLIPIDFFSVFALYVCFFSLKRAENKNGATLERKKTPVLSGFFHNTWVGFVPSLSVSGEAWCKVFILQINRLFCVSLFVIAANTFRCLNGFSKICCENILNFEKKMKPNHSTYVCMLKSDSICVVCKFWWFFFSFLSVSFLCVLVFFISCVFIFYFFLIFAQKETTATTTGNQQPLQ